MPEIDVSEVLLDSEVAGEEFIVVRRKDSANNFGEDVQQTLRFPAVGSVTPLGANSLLRQEAFQTEEKTIRVTTDFHLRAASKDETGQGYQPDIVIWNGDAYLVRVINDFSNYGRGMVTAECSSIDYVDEAPA